MIILPAIDLIDGVCVRLVRGDYKTAHKVAADPLDTARAFEAAGAKWIHMVDLDGAKLGRPVNMDVIERIVGGTSLRVELGGGLRDMQSVGAALERGVQRVVLGSAALTDRQFVEAALTAYGEAIAIGVDAADGFVAADGWQNVSRVHYLDFARDMQTLGARTLIFTDISRDGTLSGPNEPMLRELISAVDCDIIASGGVKDIGHIRALKELGCAGAIAGKALYTGDLDLAAAIDVSK